MREELKLIVDVGGTWAADLTLLGNMLLTVDALAESVEDIDIDVNVNDKELFTLLDELALIKGADTAVSIGGGGRGGSFQRPPYSVGDHTVDPAKQLIRHSQRFNNMMKKIESDFGDLSKSMGQTMSAADKAADTFELSNLRMSDLHNAVARLVPLILVFIGALPALIAGVVSLAAAAISAAAALAAITAIGAIGFTMTQGGFDTIISEIRSDFMDAFGPLARDLAPLFADGLDGLEDFFDALAARGDVLRAFADDARAFGAFLIDYLPDAIANMGLLADASSEMFGMIGAGLQDISFTEAFANFLAQALPTLKAFARAMLDFLPTLVNISIGFLDVVNAVMSFLGVIGTLLSWIPMSEQAVGFMIASLLTLGTVALIAASSLGTILFTALTRVGAAATGLSTTSIPSLTFSFSALRGAAISAAGGVTTLTNAVRGLLITTGIGILIAGLSVVATKALNASNNIDSATESLKNFRDVGRRLGRDNPYGPEPDIEDELDRYASGSSANMGGPTIEVTDSEEFDTKLKNNQFRDWSNAT